MAIVKHKITIKTKRMSKMKKLQKKFQKYNKMKIKLYLKKIKNKIQLICYTVELIIMRTVTMNRLMMMKMKIINIIIKVRAKIRFNHNIQKVNNYNHNNMKRVKNKNNFINNNKYL